MFKSLNYNSKYLTFITISGLLILNFVLKLTNLGTEPFWYDEIVSVKTSLLDFGHIKHISEWDNNPPFYYYCLWVWVKLFGISELKVRLLSVVFSSLSVSLLFFLIRKHLNYLAALSTALLFTFHNFSFAYAQETRCYSLVVLLVLTSSFFFFNFLEDPNYRNLFWLGFFNFLIVYTHYIAGMIILFQLLVLFIYRKELSRLFFISLGICLVFVALRFTKKQFLVMLSFNKEGKTFWLQTADGNLLKETLADLFSASVIWPLFLIAFIVAFILIIRKGKPPVFLTYSLFLSIGSISLLFILGLIKPLFLGRYLLFTIPFLLIPMGWLLFNTHKLAPYLLLVLLSLQLIFMDFTPKKPMDFKMAARVVTNLKNSNSAMIILQTKDITALFAYYYNKETFMDHKNTNLILEKNKIFEMENANDLGALPFKNENSIILCQTFDKAGDNNQIFDIFKQNNFVFTTTKSVKGVKISLLKKIKPL